MQRNMSLDILKLAMAFMVVGLHAGFLNEFTSLGHYLTVNGFFRIAVPVFLIINGYYFCDVVLKGNYLNWFKRLVVLYLFWMLIYSVFWFELPGFSFIEIARLLFKFFIGYHHLWYVSGMIGAAVMLVMLRNRSSKLLFSLMCITFLCGVLIQYLGNYHYFGSGFLDKLFNLTWMHRNAILFSYPFFCLGYLIKKHEFYKKLDKNQLYLMVFIGLVFLLLESYYNFSRQGGAFDIYLSLIFVAPAIFLLFNNINVIGSSKSIALYSSSIYFVHSFVLSVLIDFTNLGPSLITVCCITLSFLLSIAVLKIHERFRFIL
ncbi:acyltransferase family protein (plasmid) [Pseudoalteromonas xiamenensis]|uniref:acyltransferase n=1 Tax=Pseudoalteromonas xiamenensis TaxID=882626 RepID=UPI0027E3B2E2|nr:acyltransferase family protein [Pseudoalteromonas xiamenensis]WMN61686.1 acyltransferase family protein [Pseudoalteromonas xiamenensis]